MSEVKWIKVGDVIEINGEKAKLKSIGEDSRYATIYTFKREDGSKFHWRHNEVYRYVMDRHIGKLESLLCEEKQRADEAEEKWEKFKKSVKQLEKDINKWYYDSEDVLQELFDIMIRIERGED